MSAVIYFITPPSPLPVHIYIAYKTQACRKEESTAWCVGNIYTVYCSLTVPADEVDDDEIYEERKGEDGVSHSRASGLTVHPLGMVQQPFLSTFEAFSICIQ